MLPLVEATEQRVEKCQWGCAFYPLYARRGNGVGFIREIPERTG